MNEECHPIAERAEKQMEKVYLSVTIEALIIEITALGVIFYYLHLTAFTVMQAIGASLIILLVASIVIMLRKKRIKKKIVDELEQSGISAEAFKTYLEANTLEYELIRPLFIEQGKKSHKD